MEVAVGDACFNLYKVSATPPHASATVQERVRWPCVLAVAVGAMRMSSLAGVEKVSATPTAAEALGLPQGRVGVGDGNIDTEAEQQRLLKIYKVHDEQCTYRSRVGEKV